MRLAQFTEHSLARQEISAIRPRSYVVRDANDQSLAYVYSRTTENEALQAKALTEDEAHRHQHRPLPSAHRRSVVCEHRKLLITGPAVAN